MATETMSFVIDATEKMQSGRIGADRVQVNQRAAALNGDHGAGNALIGDFALERPPDAGEADGTHADGFGAVVRGFEGRDF